MIDTTYDVDVIAAGNGATMIFSHGDIIHRRGEAGDCAFIVKSGKVEIRQKGRAVETVSAGEIFGELALLDDEPRDATAAAVGSVEVITIDRPLFVALLRDDPEFALTVTRLLARRLRATTATFEHCVDELPQAMRPSRQARA